LTSKIAIGALVAVAVAVASEPESTRVLENDLVTVLLGDAQIRVTGDDGQARVVDRHHGEVRWMDPVGGHTVENVGVADLLAIRVEIKQARVASKLRRSMYDTRAAGSGRA
jgi:oxalate decarboxylase/phosphoglucose isomerase-like protein (cupin superfamily)